jgi:hypothetical protein
MLFLSRLIATTDGSATAAFASRPGTRLGLSIGPPAQLGAESIGPPLGGEGLTFWSGLSPKGGKTTPACVQKMSILTLTSDIEDDSLPRCRLAGDPLRQSSPVWVVFGGELPPAGVKGGPARLSRRWL